MFVTVAVYRGPTTQTGTLVPGQFINPVPGTHRFGSYAQPNQHGNQPSGGDYNYMGPTHPINRYEWYVNSPFSDGLTLLVQRLTSHSKMVIGQF